jgi:hypothetical protein
MTTKKEPQTNDEFRTEIYKVVYDIKTEASKNFIRYFYLTLAIIVSAGFHSGVMWNQLKVTTEIAKDNKIKTEELIRKVVKLEIITENKL